MIGSKGRTEFAGRILFGCDGRRALSGGPKPGAEAPVDSTQAIMRT